MMLRELKRLAESQGLLDDPHYEPKPVKYLIRIDESGKCLCIESTVEPVPPEERGRPRPKSFPVPRRRGKTSGNEGDFLVENSEYVFGHDPSVRLGARPKNPRNPGKLAVRRASFLAEIEALAAATGDAGARAMAAFLRQTDSIEAVRRLTDLEQNDLFAFTLAGAGEQLISDRPAVREYWIEKREGAGTGRPETECLVCGFKRPAAKKSPKIERLAGAGTMGASLVSFNKDAFMSYGLRRAENAPICQPCADGYTTGLNWLLRGSSVGGPKSRGRQAYRVTDDTTAVFWSKNAEFDDVFSLWLDGNADAIAALIGSPWKGHATGLDENAPFYMALVSGAEGRAILQGWIESTVQLVASNIRRYFSESLLTRASNRDSETTPLRDVVRSLAAQSEVKNFPQTLAGSLFETIVLGRRFPSVLLEMAIRRVRMEGDVPRVRIGLIKAILIRNHGMEVKKVIDGSNTNTGYRLGRLFAVLERLQGAAIGRPKASIVDKYFGAASKSPVLVFPRLLSLAQHHASKAENGRYFQKLIEEIVDPLEPTSAFPSVLDLPTQGMFALGYYHQRAALWRKKDPAAAEESE